MNVGKHIIVTVLIGHPVKIHPSSDIRKKRTATTTFGVDKRKSPTYKLAAD